MGIVTVLLEQVEFSSTNCPADSRPHFHCLSCLGSPSSVPHNRDRSLRHHEFGFVWLFGNAFDQLDRRGVGTGKLTEYSVTAAVTYFLSCKSFVFRSSVWDTPCQTLRQTYHFSVSSDSEVTDGNDRVYWSGTLGPVIRQRYLSCLFSIDRRSARCKSDQERRGVTTAREDTRELLQCIDIKVSSLTDSGQLGDYPYGYIVYRRVQMNAQCLLRELSGLRPLCRAMDIVSNPRVWNHNTGAVSFESWPPFKIQGSGGAAILATSIQPGPCVVPVPCL